MAFFVQKIEEDLSYGCESHNEELPVMAVVTLIDESGESFELKTPDQLLYEQAIEEGMKVDMLPVSGLPGFFTLYPIP